MKFASALGFASLALGTFAAPFTHVEIESKASQGLRLLRLSEDSEPVWKTEDEKLELLRVKTKFVSHPSHECRSS
jgi:bacterial leucyl aminopeptidase